MYVHVLVALVRIATLLTEVSCAVSWKVLQFRDMWHCLLLAEASVDEYSPCAGTDCHKFIRVVASLPLLLALQLGRLEIRVSQQHTPMFWLLFPKA